MVMSVPVADVDSSRAGSPTRSKNAQASARSVDVQELAPAAWPVPQAVTLGCPARFGLVGICGSARAKKHANSAGGSCRRDRRDWSAIGGVKQHNRVSAGRTGRALSPVIFQRWRRPHWSAPRRNPFSRQSLGSFGCGRVFSGRCTNWPEEEAAASHGRERYRGMESCSPRWGEVDRKKLQPDTWHSPGSRQPSPPRWIAVSGFSFFEKTPPPSPAKVRSSSRRVSQEQEPRLSPA